MDFSNKKALVWDSNGEGVEHAIRLAKDFAKVFYFTPWCEDPEYAKAAYGEGMEGVERILKFFDYVDKVDLIYFVNTGFGDCAHFLRQKGYRVFGAGKGEVLEEERYKARMLQKKLGLPTQKTKEITGVSALEIFCNKNPKSYCKLPIFRADAESFSAEDILMVADELRVGFGPMKEKRKFMVEEHIEAIAEIGSDGCFGNQFIEPCLWGIETGKKAYIGTYANLPGVLKNTMDKLTPTLQKLDYRGWFSTEERLLSKDKGVLVDITARPPYYVSLVYTESIKNYSEVIWNVADGKKVVIEPRFKYVCCVPVITKHADKYWTELRLNPKLRHKIKLWECMKVDGKYYAVKGAYNGFLLMSLANDVKKCIEDVKALADEVDAHELDKSGIGMVDSLTENIANLKKIGIDF